MILPDPAPAVHRRTAAPSAQREDAAERTSDFDAHVAEPRKPAPRRAEAAAPEKRAAEGVDRTATRPRSASKPASDEGKADGVALAVAPTPAATPAGTADQSAESTGLTIAPPAPEPPAAEPPAPATTAEVPEAAGSVAQADAPEIATPVVAGAPVPAVAKVPVQEPVVRAGTVPRPAAETGRAAPTVDAGSGDAEVLPQTDGADAPKADERPQPSVAAQAVAQTQGVAGAAGRVEDAEAPRGDQPPAQEAAALPAPAPGREAGPAARPGAPHVAPAGETTAAFRLEALHAAAAGPALEHMPAAEAPRLTEASAARGADPQAVVAQVAVAVAKAEDRRIELRLDPPELGRVHIHLTETDRGVQAVVVAQRPETYDLLRRHGELLAQELAAAGYGSVDLDFAAGREAPGRDETPARDWYGAGAPAEPMAADAPRRTAAAGLDIRL